MNPQFETADDVDREYQRRIDSEPDRIRKAELKAEAAEAKVRLREAAADQRAVDAYRKAAFADFPEAKLFPQLVTGTTESEIMASAEAAHNRVVELRGGARGEDPYEDARRQAQEYYGRGPTTGGATGTPTGYVPPDMGKVRKELAFAEKFNNAPRDGYGQRMGISPQETAEYTNSRFIDHVKNAVNYWGMMTNSSYAARRRS
jgi:hypothetical protein